MHRLQRERAWLRTASLGRREAIPRGRPVRRGFGIDRVIRTRSSPFGSDGDSVVSAMAAIRPPLVAFQNRSANHMLGQEGSPIRPVSGRPLGEELYIMMLAAPVRLLLERGDQYPMLSKWLSRVRGPRARRENHLKRETRLAERRDRVTESTSGASYAIMRVNELADEISRSDLFDGDFYIRTYLGAPIEGMSAPVHYVLFGAMLGMAPSEKFDSLQYLEMYADVRQSGMNPLIHYLRHGRAEGRVAPSARPPDARTDVRVPASDEWKAKKSPEKDPATSTVGRHQDDRLNSSTYSRSRSYHFREPEQLEADRIRYFAARRNRGDVGIFTANVGAYEAIKYHEYLNEDYDYLLFTDHPPLYRHVYTVLPPPVFDEDPTRMARFVKTHPHVLMADYDIAVWMDSNILIRGDLDAMVAAFRASGEPVGAIPHPLRSSVYEEAEECVRRAKDDAVLIGEQMIRYRAEGFDCNSLIESCVVFYRIGHPKLMPIMSEWWKEIDRGSRRDQLSFNVALARAGSTYHPLTRRPDSARNHPAFAFFHHDSGGNRLGEFRASGWEPLPARTEDLERRIAAQATRRADIVICVHNALDWVRCCLEAVAATRNAAVHRIILVDDGSGVETADFLRDAAETTPNTLLVRHDQALGYTRAANAGLRLSEAEFVVLLNSDTIPTRHWIEKLMDAAFSKPHVGLVGPMSNAASHQSLPDHQSTVHQTAVNDLPPGFGPQDMNAWCEGHARGDACLHAPLIHGFCFGMTREVIDRVGLFDEENFKFGYGEENDYCFRAVDAGFAPAIATNTFVYHEKSQSYQTERRKALTQAGNARLRELHGNARVARAIRNVQNHPELIRLRGLAEKLFVLREK